LIASRIKSLTLQAALYASVATIPLSNQSNSISIIIFVAACFIQQPLRKGLNNLKRSNFWILPIIYFLWSICTYFWDTSGGFTVKELERYTILLFIPPAIAMVPLIPTHIMKRACILFVIVTTTICIACLIKANQEYRLTGDYRVFYYQYLGEQMKLNAIFLSNYCLASTTWLLYYGFIQNRNRKTLDYFLVIITCAFLFLMIFLLSSKLIIFLTVLIVIIFVLGVAYLHGYFLRGLLVALLLIVTGFIAITQFSYLRWRIYSTEFKMYSGPQDDQNGIAIRLFMWKTTIGLIEKRPLLGYGLKGGRVKLLDTYAKTGFDLGVRGFYHSHNQYLESTLMAGIPATVLLLVFIVFALTHAVRHKNFLLILMMCHFVIQSMFEATFEVQHELVFYIFFIFLFYYHAAEIRRTA
jgi:O-antigen ligase